jgi:hypothetical protein
LQYQEDQRKEGPDGTREGKERGKGRDGKGRKGRKEREEREGEKGRGKGKGGISEKSIN